MTPTLNQGQFIGQTLQCVAQQKGPDDLYVVVDGGSSDETPQWLERFNDSIDAVHIMPGLSQAGALAFAFENYGADICCWLNSDDLWPPGTLDFIRDYFVRHPKTDVIYGDRIFISRTGKVEKTWSLPRHADWLMRRWDYIPQEASFWRQKAMHLAGGIDPDVAFAVDYDLFLRMMRVAKFQHVARYMGAFRVHPDSKTSTQNETLGKDEVARLKLCYKVASFPGERVIGRLLRYFVALNSKFTAIKRQDQLQSIAPTLITSEQASTRMSQ